MSARAKAPKAVEAWAVLDDDGAILLNHIYVPRATAEWFAEAQHTKRRVARVLITPAPRRRKP